MSDIILADNLAAMGLPLKMTAVNSIEGHELSIVAGETYEFAGFEIVPNEDPASVAVGYIQHGSDYVRARVIVVSSKDYEFSDRAKTNVAFAVDYATIESVKHALVSNRQRVECLKQLEAAKQLIKDGCHVGASAENLRLMTYKPQYCDFGDASGGSRITFVRLGTIPDREPVVDGVVYSCPDTIVSHVQPNGVVIRMALESYRLMELSLPDEYRFDTGIHEGPSRISLSVRSVPVETDAGCSES